MLAGHKMHTNNRIEVRVDKYGRVLGQLFIQVAKGIQMNGNHTIIRKGHAWVYDSGTKQVFSA